MLINKNIEDIKTLKKSGDYKEYFHPVTKELTYLNANEKNNEENLKRTTLAKPIC